MLINPVFAVAAVLGVLLPLLPTKAARSERRLYWSGTAIASVSAFLALYPPDWRGGLGLAGAVAGVLTLRAYMNTSYLVVRGRTRTFNVRKTRSTTDGEVQANVAPPGAYGGNTSAPKAWWLIVVVTGVCALMVASFVVSREGPWYAIGAVLTVCLIAIGIGHQDGSWGYPLARGQLVQLTAAGLATGGLFLVPYYLAHRIGKRWPMSSRRSMEYRAHPDR